MNGLPKKEEIKFSDFVELVVQTRRAQRLYFKTREQKYIIRSKELEIQLDQLTAILTDTQGKLF